VSTAPLRVRLTAQVTPNARRSEVIGMSENVLRIRLHAPPVDGKANVALVRFLAEALDLRKSALTIVAGHTARRKIIEVSGSGMTGEQTVAALIQNPNEA
jgi:uncharacterized protein (TIGR00251 family)